MDYLWEITDFWEKTKGLCGYLELNLEEIYHGILRCNKPHPTKQVPVLYENEDDERLIGIPREFLTGYLGLERLDPRIHFALSIGCKACPPIQIFSLHEHECQLDEVAKNYVRSRVKIDADRRIVKLPILFLWYEEDFGNNRRVMLWYLKRFLLAKDALKIRKLVTSRRCIYFHYESFDYQLDPYVRRHPSPTCVDVDHRKAITTYWGINY
ncbi:unnamed protein product [Orchesella dallaii]|uniref:DUF547 domain-containing protein n=1 Tax=Orchesella dallaii TaxID=48710 RepID=A0ABP1S3E8_9HEXA